MEHKDYELNNLTKYYYIELPKFRNANPYMILNLNMSIEEIGKITEHSKKRNIRIEK